MAATVDGQVHQGTFPVGFTNNRIRWGRLGRIRRSKVDAIFLRLAIKNIKDAARFQGSLYDGFQVI